MKRCAVAFATFLVVLSHAAFAEESTDQTTTPEPGLLSRTLASLKDARDSTSETYISLTRSIDNYLAGKKIEDEINDSYMRLDLQQTFYKQGDTQDDVHLNAKLDLPGTEKRFKLIFESNPDELQTLENRTEDLATGQRVEREGSVAGVEYANPAKPEEWKNSFTAGVRLHISPIPFVRERISREWELQDNWRSYFRQTFWYYDDKGTGATTELSFMNRWSSTDTFAITPQFEIRHRDNKYYYGLVLGDVHKLDESSWIGFRVGALASNDPTNEVSTYFIATPYRRFLYKQWLILNLTPQLTFPHKDNWQTAPSFTAGLQVYFE